MSRKRLLKRIRDGDEDKILLRNCDSFEYLKEKLSRNGVKLEIREVSLRFYFDCKEYTHISRYCLASKMEIEAVLGYLLSVPDSLGMEVKGRKLKIWPKTCVMEHFPRAECFCGCGCKHVTRQKGVKLRGNSWEDTEAYLKYSPKQNFWLLTITR